MSTAIQNTVTQTVVSNDTQKAAITASTTTQTAATLLLEMEQKRENWETTVYRTSNLALYAVLGDCLAYGGDLNFQQTKERSAVLDEFCKSRGYVVKKDSPLLTRIAKAVFGNVDRRRISTYSLVLRRAKAEGITPANLSAWIEELGGIQEIKLAKSATYVAPADKVKSAKQSLAMLPNLAVISNTELSKLADGDFMGDECVFIAEQQADGSFAIKAFTRSAGAVNAALTSFYGQVKEAA
jgi:hypothetical protein